MSRLRYVEGFGLRPRAAGLDVVGGKRTARLKQLDDQATTLRVVDLVRAGHSLDDAAERLGLPRDAVQALVTPLVRLGALTQTAAPPADAPPQMVRYLERTLGAEAAAPALDRLARATVSIDGDTWVRDAMREQLRCCGVGTVADGPAAAADRDAPALVISFRPADPNVPASDAPTLFVALGAAEASVGPLCGVPGGRCRYCLDTPPAPPVPPSADDADPLTVQVAIALAAGEAVRWLAGLGFCRTGGGVIRVRSRGKDQSFAPIWRDAGCPRCGLPGATVGDEAFAAYRAFQAADVPLKTNRSYPIGPVEVPPTDCTIKVLPLPVHGSTDETWLDALRVATDALATVASVGGTRLLNVFVCGAPDGEPVLSYVDLSGRAVRPLPGRGLRDSALLSAGRLTVVLTAVVSSAEAVFGEKGRLVVHQDTGFALGALRAALARHGFSSTWRPVPARVAGDIAPILGIDAARDAVTAIVDVDLDRGPAQERAVERRPRASRSVDRADLDAVLAAVPPEDTFVRCYRTRGIAARLYRTTWQPAAVSVDEVDNALHDRGLAPAALVLFSSDIGRALPGIMRRVVAQAEAAQGVHDRARERGLDALLLSDLPTTALAPDSRGWRTAYRSFAAVALDVRGRLDGVAEPAVRW